MKVEPVSIADKFEQASDRRPWLERAVKLAGLSVAEDCHKPRPRVGAVIVANGRIISEGYRNEDGQGGHAEEIALRKVPVPERNLLSQATLITTLEPCFRGRSPSKAECTYLIIKNRIWRVIIGIADPDRDTRVLGVEALYRAGVEVEWFPNDLAAEVRDLNSDFLSAHLDAQLPNLFLGSRKTN